LLGVTKRKTFDKQYIIVSQKFLFSGQNCVKVDKNSPQFFYALKNSFIAAKAKMCKLAGDNI
jgi:hypothetical protein